MLRSVVVASSIIGLASAECPNACSSHGKCTAYDMCLCYRNWMANDCSERICQFGLAHVDTPKGDLDASGGELDGPDSTDIAIYSEMYPFGTTEQFPDSSVDNAHYYMECSNKGICDRQAGTCECFPGYEGSACQRASCPTTGGAVCSGHGTCETIKQISARDASNVYELWDEKSTLGCVCDAGYYGADCALRECKYGADPLYFDDNANIRFDTWTVMFTADSGSISLQGTYAIVFYDHFGEDWQTGPIAHDATCDEIVAALEDIPNDVIPDNSVRCQMYTSSAWDNPNYASAFTRNLFVKYTLSFRENPGLLKEIGINKYLDGDRPTLYTSEATSTLAIKVYADGIHGEDYDFVPDECRNVIVSFSTTTFDSMNDVGGTTAMPILTFSDAEVMVPLLKRCLGHSDNDFSYSGTENQVYNWDFGTMQNPHLVKFVPVNAQTTNLCKPSEDTPCSDTTPPGFYAPVIYALPSTKVNDDDRKFVVYSRAPEDFSGSEKFRIYTTTGYLNRVSYEADVYTRGTSSEHAYDHPNVLFTVNNAGTVDNDLVMANDATADLDLRDPLDWNGDIDCETQTPRDITKEDCLKKNDWAMFFSMDHNTLHVAANPKYHNLYQIEKIYKAYPTVDTPTPTTVEEPLRNRIVLNMHTNLFVPLRDSETQGRLTAYKFYPPARPVRYVDQCSGRGLCNSAEGLCECFPGYANDDCSIQNGGAV